MQQLADFRLNCLRCASVQHKLEFQSLALSTLEEQIAETEKQRGLRNDNARQMVLARVGTFIVLWHR